MSGRTPRVRVLGAGRAGSAFAQALRDVGVEVHGPWRRDVDPATAAQGVDLVLVCVSDAAVAEVAARIVPDPRVVVAHVSGSLGLDVLAPHERRASLHPVLSLPDASTGAARLTSHAPFVVAGDEAVGDVVEALGGREISVADADRVLHHAACCIASNHVVALLGQVERLAARIGVDPGIYLELARGTVDNVVALGAAAALTGPAARGDLATIERHLAALPDDERAGYAAMVELARRLASGREGAA